MESVRARWERHFGVEAPYWKRELWSWGTTLVVFLFVITCVGQAYVVPTGSMEGTLLIGDHLVVNKIPYGPLAPVVNPVLGTGELERGDIVCFRFPLKPSETYVKRLIGLPGDRVRMVNGQVFVNGVAADEPYVIHKQPGVSALVNNVPRVFPPGMPERGLRAFAANVRGGEIVVPEGQLFVMGDNRDESFDSRYWGFVPREEVIGRPLVVYWSYATTTERLLPWVDVEHLADLAVNFFPKTRWERTGLVPDGGSSR